MTEELDSQLSAMFDDELPHSECELLARRLARDEGLRQRWGRYAAIRACFREEGSERSVHIAARVRAGLKTDSSLDSSTMPHRRIGESLRGGLWRRAAGIAVACGVAALAILWVRSESLPPTIAASGLGTAGVSTAGLAAPVLAAAAPTADATAPPVQVQGAEPDSYVTPAATDTPAFAPTTELANYVVAHSEYSTPINRRSLLSSFVASEALSPGAAGPAEAPAPPPQDESRDRPNVER